MTVDQLPSLEGNFLGGCQCERHQPRLRGSQRGIQHIVGSSQRTETGARADRGQSGRIMVRSLLVYLTTLQRPGGHREHHPLVGRGSLRPGKGGLGGYSSSAWESGLRWLWGPPHSQSCCLHHPPWGCKSKKYYC